MTRVRKWLPALISAAAIGFISPSPCSSGSFLISSNFGGTVDAIVHPFLYVGAGGPLTVNVCTSPSFAEIDSAEPAIVRAIATWNSLAFQNNNLEQATPEGFADFETIMLHELGHCGYGLDHPNLSGLVEPQVARMATIALTGENQFFDFSAGVDGAPGSPDDLRGDDENYFWFRKFDNDPFFAIGGAIDTTTYSRDLMDLPVGSLFAANANRLSGPASSPPVLDTESIMNGIFFEGDRIHEIQADDFSIIALGQAGLDGVGGTADDYSVTLSYLGRMDDDTVCQVMIVSSSEAPIPPARCNVSSISIGVGTNHFRLAGNGLITVSENIQLVFRRCCFCRRLRNWDIVRMVGSRPLTRAIFRSRFSEPDSYSFLPNEPITSCRARGAPLRTSCSDSRRDPRRSRHRRT